MKLAFALHVISVLLIIQPDAILSCDTANWWASLDKKGWSVCANDRTFLTGLWRSAPGGNNGLWLIEEGKCCGASEPSYANKPSTCTNANWWSALDGKNVWALCPAGYYMEGIYITDSTNIYNIEESKCCRPQNHPNAYEDCYDEDVTHSFDNKGWSECKRAGYYMTGIYKSGCEHVYCIEKFKCCRMKKAGGPPPPVPCDTANWWGSLDKKGWSVCPNDRKFLKGLFRSAPGGNNGLWLIEEGKCCPAVEPSYANQPSTCTNANWWGVLDPKNVWALCPTGYYMEGVYITASTNIYNLEESKCCRPQNHPNAYEDCYDEDVTHSFDNKGWSMCKRAGYYMTGIYKSSCEHVYCIEKFKCCRMKKAAVNGGWTDFGPFGECSATCGGGMQERSRTCTNPPPSGGGAQCSGPAKETRACNAEPCAVDGGWSEFEEWCGCSKPCGGGFQSRERTCSNPPPAHGGKDCMGVSKETRVCNSEPCAVDGGWSEFEEWCECSKPCGGGVQSRERTCSNPPPAHGGKDCMGMRKETRLCNTELCNVDVDGGFTQWSEFSECNRTCGNGRKTRTRECTNPPPSGKGRRCKGKYSETVKCKVRSCRGKGK